MNKKIMVRAVWFVVVLVVCAGVFLWLGFDQNKNSNLPAPRPDAISTSTVSDENIRIENKTAGYAITVPRNWYLEKSAGSGVTVYPDYDVAEKTSSNCKIEISALANPDKKEISDWLVAYFAGGGNDVQETSEEAAQIPAGDAVIWRGVLNEVSTTLAYAATGTAVYEFAPSVIAAAGNGAPLSADCESALMVVLKNFEFVK